MITEKQYRDFAAAHCVHEGEVEVDDDAEVSVSPDGGAYVQAWVWVDNDVFGESVFGESKKSGSTFADVIAEISHWRIRITESVLGVESTVETTWGEFCNDNSEDLDMLWEARRELEGCGDGTYQGGGGAAPVFKLTRVGEKAEKVAIVWTSPECSYHSSGKAGAKEVIVESVSVFGKREHNPHDPFDPIVVLQDFEEAGGPEGAEYIAVMRAIAEEATKRAKIYEERCRTNEIKELTKVSDALWELRGKYPAVSIAAKVIESFASYIACLASDGRYDEDTFSGFYNNLHSDLGYTPPSRDITKKG